MSRFGILPVPGRFGSGSVPVPVRVGFSGSRPGSEPGSISGSEPGSISGSEPGAPRRFEVTPSLWLKRFFYTYRSIAKYST